MSKEPHIKTYKNNIILPPSPSRNVSPALPGHPLFESELCRGPGGGNYTSPWVDWVDWVELLPTIGIQDLGTGELHHPQKEVILQ